MARSLFLHQRQLAPRDDEEEEEQEGEQVLESAEWLELLDTKGRTRCWNRHTRQSAWNPPANAKVVLAGIPDKEGVLNHWHKETRVSTNDLPPPLPG